MARRVTPLPVVPLAQPVQLVLGLNGVGRAALRPVVEAGAKARQGASRFGASETDGPPPRIDDAWSAQPDLLGGDALRLVGIDPAEMAEQAA